MRPSVTMAERDIIVCRDAGELARKAAEDFILLANNSVACDGRFAVALAGGSTPRSLYALLATKKYRREVPWEDTHLFWGDERCVGPDHPDSNFRMVHETLLSKISLPPENIHRMAGEKEPMLAAAEYEARLQRFFQLDEGGLPRFDLILLGLGEDGHTASLFPGTVALEEKKRLVAANFVAKLNVHRLTLTLPVLNAGAMIDFLVAGKSKAPIVKKIFGADSEAASLPAARVRLAAGALTWFIAGDAAAGLPTR